MKTYPYLAAVTTPLLIIASLLIVTLLITGAPSASAAFLYEYHVDDPDGRGRAGRVKWISTSYNELTQEFTWTYQIGPRSGEISDGFWLVVDNGPDPKRESGQYAILYGDLEANRLTAYEYDGDNRFNSYANPGNLLDSWDNVFEIQDIGNIIVSFTIDVGTVNGAFDTDEWQGIRFDELLGIWFHPSINSEFEYDPVTGELINYEFGEYSFHDAIDQVTTATVIPLPASAYLFGSGLLMLLTRRNH